MYGQRLEERADVALRGLHVVYSALIVTYSWPRSEKKTSVSAPSPGSPTSYSTSSRGDRLRPAPPRRSAIARAARRTPARPRSRCRAAAARCRAAPSPTAWTIRPQLGSPPCSAALTSGELATARATRLDARRRAPPRTTTRPMRLAPSPSRTIVSASWRSSASSASPKRSSSSVSGSTPTPLAPRAHAGSRCRWSRAGRRPMMRSNERLTQHAEQQVGGLGRQRGVGLDEAEHRREARARSSPRPWPARSAARCPPGSSTSRLARFSNASVVRIAVGEVAVAVGAQLGAARARCPRSRAGQSSGTPITPVEATATWSSVARRRPSRRRPASCAASSSPRRPVAALALPELTTTARSASSAQRSRLSSTGRREHARAREARGARRLGRVADEQAEVERRRWA